jgi:hypothetical protein
MSDCGEIRGSDRRRGERGQFLVMFAFLAVALIGLMAMVIDVGVILHERRQLQNTADAAALAGAIELPASTALADSKAKEWAEKNGIDLDEGDKLSISVDPIENQVTVEVEREVPFLFGRVLGLTLMDVDATATAQVGSPAALSNILPFGVPENALKYTGPTVLKYDASNPANGNFGSLRIDGNGAAVHEKSIKYGTENAICAISQPLCENPFVNTQTGNTISASRNGFNYRFNNTSAECDSFDEVLIPQGDGTYRINGPCSPFSAGSKSLRLVMVPVIDKFCNGTCTVTIQYFTVMFLQGFNSSKCTGNSCEITASFVKVVMDPHNDALLGTYDPVSGVTLVRLVD